MNMFLLCHYLQFLMHVTQAHVKTMPHAHLPMAFTPAAVQAVSQEHNANQVGDTICNENTSSLHVIDHKNNDQMEIPDATSLYSVFDACVSSPCGNNGTCTSNNGIYSCSCPGGFTGAQCESGLISCFRYSQPVQEQIRNK